MAAMHLRVAYLRHHGATRETPLSIFKKATKWKHILGDNITDAIRAVIRTAGPVIGFNKAEISACYL